MTDNANIYCKKNTVIEASAGTGKTYTITKNIVPQLLEAGHDLSKILVVTYTEKAAGELRSRIRKELNKILWPTTDEEINEANKKSDKFKARLAQQIEEIDDAPIFTIHSFCQKILNENAVYANCSQNTTIIDEGVGLDNFIGLYVRDILCKNNVFMYLYAKTHDAADSSIQAILRDAVKKYYLDKNGNKNDDVISVVQLNQDEEKKYCDLVQKIENLTPDDAETIAEIDMNLPMIIRGFVIKNLAEIYVAWRAYKENQNLQSYDDIIKSVHNAITEKNSELLRVLKNEYDCAIIDEFQDTNQLQWNIFKQIFTTDNKHHLIIVGDPKQSIFSFQGADCEVYKIAKEYLTDNDNTIRLDVNYRSSASMITAVNKLVMMPEVCNGFDQDGYRESRAPSDADKQIQPARLSGAGVLQPVHIINTPEEKDTDACPEDTIVSKIIEYCTQDQDAKTMLQVWDKQKKEYRNVNFNDFAILVHKRNDANKLIAKLQKAKIPFAWHKDNTLFKGKEITDWISLLGAIQLSDFNDKNQKKLRQVLQTDFFDVPLDKINDDCFNDILCHERQLLLKWHRLAEAKQYSKLLNSIFEDSHISDRLASYDKIQSLAKYNQIGNFVLESLVCAHNCVATVIKTLKQQKSSTDNSDDIYTEKATDNPIVKLSTIHSAKGLEFPIVFYFMIPPAKEKSEFVHIIHNGPQGTLLDIDDRAVPKDPDLQSLYYVALTRAMSLMYIINVKKVKSERKYAISNPDILVQEAPDLFAIDDCDNKFTSAEQILIHKNTAGIDKTDQEKPCDEINMTYKRLYKHSYTSLSHRTTPQNDADDDIMTETSQRIDKELPAESVTPVMIEKFDHGCGTEIRNGIYTPDNTAKTETISYLERGKTYGTTVHEVFEHIDFNKFDSGDKIKHTQYLGKIIERCAKKYLISRNNDDSEQVSGRIGELIANTMGAKIPEVIGNRATGGMFKLSSVKNTDKKTEIEFNLNINPDAFLNYCNGFIDLLFVREINGTPVYSLLDWKTDYFDECEYANYDYLKQHTDMHYPVQRVLYSYCLIKWLKQFYPEMSESDVFQNHFGGIYYAYVRGCKPGTSNGIYPHTWRDFETLEKAFNRINDIIKGKHDD